MGLEKSKIFKLRLPVVVTVLLVACFTLGGVAGMFVYATGQRVQGETFMKMISHTEYRFGESGQIVARLVNYQGLPVVVDNCTATILYPDKSVFVDSALMSDSTNISGDHYYNFTTPSSNEGVYEYQATCYYTVGANHKSKSVTNSFHLSSGFNVVQERLVNLSNDLSSVNASLSQEVFNLSTQVNSNISSVLSAINGINVSDGLNSSFQEVVDLINSVNDSRASEYQVVTSFLSDINGTVDQNQQYLLSLNTSVANVYDYLTVTLTNKVDQILGSLSIINATVNRIETNTLSINSTVNDIKTNQEAEVYMNVFSG